MNGDVEPGSITVTNTGGMEAVSIGGSHNSIVNRSAASRDVDGRQLAAEIRMLIDRVAPLPLDDAGRRDVASLRQAADQAEGGDVSAARRTLATVGDWVKAMTAALTANVLNGVLNPQA